MNGCKMTWVRFAPGVLALAGVMLSCSSKPTSPEVPASSLGPISPADLGELKVQGYTVVSGNKCTGFLDTAAPIENGAFNAAGWAFLPALKTKPANVVIALADGTVLATPALTIARPDVKQNVPQVTVLETGFLARITPPSHKNVRAFAVLPDGKSACPLYGELKQP